MFCSIAQTVADALIKVFRFPELVTVIISILPIIEARGAIPIALLYGIKPPLAFLYAFLGSSLTAPVLIAVLLPFVKWLSRTKLFKRFGQALYEKFEKKSKGLADEQATPQVDGETADVKKKSDFKKMLGVFAFVAIPLPMTGVWTGSAVASVTGLKYPKALIAVVSGNIVACGIITILCYFLSDYLNYIILAIGIIAIAVIVVFIIKVIVHKPKNTIPETESAESKENN